MDNLCGHCGQPGRPSSGADEFADDNNVAVVSNDDAWAAFDHVSQSVRFADLKATALLAADGVLGGLILSRSGPADDSAVAYAAFATLMVALCLVTVSAAISLLALVPRLGHRVRDNS